MAAPGGVKRWNDDNPCLDAQQASFKVRAHGMGGQGAHGSGGRG